MKRNPWSQKVIKRLRIIKMFRPKNEETFIQRCLLAVESATADRTVFRSPLRRKQPETYYIIHITGWG